MKQKDVDRMMKVVDNYLADIPYNIQVKNEKSVKAGKML